MCQIIQTRKIQGKVGGFGHNFTQSVQYKSSSCNKRANILLYLKVNYMSDGYSLINIPNVYQLKLNAL